MSATLDEHGEFTLQTGIGAGVAINLPSNTGPSAGQYDVICINSDATIQTPSGFILADSTVISQGSYVFYREAAGGESASVTIQSVPAGNHRTNVAWSRWDNVDAFDRIDKASTDNVLGTTTPSFTTGTFATAEDLIIAFAALHNAELANAASMVVPSGFTEIASFGQGASGQSDTIYSSTAYKTPAGTAAESPQFSWTNGMRDRYVFAIAFTTLAGNATVEPGSTESQEQFGSASLLPGVATAIPGSTDSLENFGNASLSPGGANSIPGSVLSEEDFGTASLVPGTATSQIGTSDSNEEFGSASLIPGDVTISPGSSESGESFGSSLLSPGTVTLSPGSVSSEENFGDAFVGQNVPQTISPGTISSEETFGNASVVPPPRKPAIQCDISRVVIQSPINRQILQCELPDPL